MIIKFTSLRFSCWAAAALFLYSCAVDKTVDHLMETETCFEKGVKAYELCNFDKSADLFLSHIKTDSSNGNAYIGLSKSYARLNKLADWYGNDPDSLLDLASSALRKASEFHHDLTEYNIARALIYREKEIPDSMKLSLDLVLDDNPYHCEALVLMGDYYRSSITAENDPKTAIDYYLKGLLENPNFVPGLVNLGSVYRGIRKDDHAQSHYEKALRLNPDLYRGTRWRMTVLQDAERYDEALITANELIASGRASYKTYNDQGWLYLYLSRPEEALASFKTSVEMDTSAVISQVFLANALRETGEFTASLDILNKLLALKMDTYTNNIKCWTLYKMDKAEEAVTCYNSTIEFEPDHPEAYYRLGWIFWEMEKWELAAEYYDLCDEISSGYKSTKWYQNSLKILIHNRD